VIGNTEFSASETMEAAVNNVKEKIKCINDQQFIKCGPVSPVYLYSLHDLSYLRGRLAMNC
jgi:hypothetical protein